MKPFPAVLREKRRYMNFEIISEKAFSRQEVSKALWDAVFRNIGAYGAASAAFWVMDFNDGTKKGILRCTTKDLDIIRASIALLDRINGAQAMVKMTNVAGSIKKSKKKEAINLEVMN